MGDLRELIEGDLAETLESDFGLPVILTSPAGVVQTKSENNPTQDLQAQVHFDSLVLDPNTGLDIVVDKPVISLRRTSLTTIPTLEDGQNWKVEIPDLPKESSPKTTFRASRVPEHGRSIGFIRMYLEAIEQSA